MLEHRLLPAADKNSKRLLVMMHGLGDSLAGYLWMPEVLRLPWLNYVLPNVYFHVTTAYAILRHNGVEIGKQDFLGKFDS